MGQEPLNLRFQKAAANRYALSLDSDPAAAGIVLRKEGKQYLSVYINATIVIGQPTRITWSSTEGKEWMNIAPATAAYGAMIGVPLRAHTA
ncbi:hypothetical protein LCGC14_1340560, partial [marine sediment metagenome]